MGIPAVFYVPLLHNELAPSPVSGSVSFFPVGLPTGKKGNLARASAQGASGLACDSFLDAGNAEAESAARGAENAVRASLPLAPSEARAVLEEMIRLGEEYSPNGLLRQIAAHEAMGAATAYGSGARKGAGAGERAALDEFVSTGQVATPSVRMPDWGAPVIEAAQIRQALVDCQKTLLLAHALEERTQEMALLESRLHKAEASLQSLLHEGDAEHLEELLQESEPKEAFDAEALADGISGTAKNPADPVSWRVVVDAALPFLPSDAVLFTADPVMAHDLRRAGMLQPFPEDRADVCREWPFELVTGLLFACLPAWRLVGRRGPLPERPWLNREIEVLVARPEGGWLDGSVTHKKDEVRL